MVNGTFLVHSNIRSLVGPGIVILYLNCSKNYSVNKSDQNNVGASLSEPHLVEMLDEFVCLPMCTVHCAISHLQLFASCINSKMIHKM